MKVTELNEDLLNEITTTSTFLIDAINSYRKQHRVTHDSIAIELSMSQSTVSKMLSQRNVSELANRYGNLSVSEARKICKAMGTTLGNVLNEYEQHIAQNSANYDERESREYSAANGNENIPEYCRNIPSEEKTVYPACLFEEGANLVNRKTDPMFLQWFGTYHCYFFSTISTECECFYGTLEIPQFPRDGCCNVHFSFDYGKKRKKQYYGQMVLSRKNNGAYITLVNHSDQGEITYLVMTNPAVNNSSVCCAVALVSTISAGKYTKHPCAERMIISRVPLSGPRFDLIKAHLLLNDKNILISEDAFLNMLNDDNLPQEFKQWFRQDKSPFDKEPFDRYWCRMAQIPESWVKSLSNFSYQEQQKIIDLLRLYSFAPRYNKINQKTAEYDIFNLFRDEFEQWILPLTPKD